MEHTKNSKWFLIIGIAIPIVVIVFIAIFSYTPGSKIEPKYDFLYYFRDYTNGYCVSDGIYTVSKGKIKIAEIPAAPKGSECRYDIETDPPKIYRYDAERGGHYQLSFEDAQKFNLDNNSVSPDGLHIQRGDNYNSGMFELFGGTNRNYNSINLADGKGNVKEVDIGVSNYYDMIFIGWILE